jgi:DNA-binding NtrC family response regulator
MVQPVVLIVEQDILVRHPLAEYLRGCGYNVIEAATQSEARAFLGSGRKIDVMLADMSQLGGADFDLISWTRTIHPHIDLLLAGTVDRAVEKAAKLCEDENAGLRKPYDHRRVADGIKRALARRKEEGS